LQNGFEIRQTLRPGESPDLRTEIRGPVLREQVHGFWSVVLEIRQVARSANLETVL